MLRIDRRMPTLCLTIRIVATQDPLTSTHSRRYASLAHRQMNNRHFPIHTEGGTVVVPCPIVLQLARRKRLIRLVGSVASESAIRMQERSRYCLPVFQYLFITKYGELKKTKNDTYDSFEFQLSVLIRLPKQYLNAQFSTYHDFQLQS